MDVLNSVVYGNEYVTLRNKTTITFSGFQSSLVEASAQPISVAQDFFSYENLKDDFKCNINGVLQGEWYSR